MAQKDLLVINEPLELHSQQGRNFTSTVFQKQTPDQPLFIRNQMECSIGLTEQWDSCGKPSNRLEQAPSSIFIGVFTNDQ